MRYLFFFFFLSVFIFANEIENKELNKDAKKINLETIVINKLSEKEKSYQEYKLKLEEENRQLEEDGFCSCNNN